MTLHGFLYSRWFFLFLAIVCVLDLVADVGETIWGWSALNYVSIALDAIIVGMALWIFTDLQRRRPKNGGSAGS
jgi:hypothetical protein